MPNQATHKQYIQKCDGGDNSSFLLLRSLGGSKNLESYTNPICGLPEACNSGCGNDLINSKAWTRVSPYFTQSEFEMDCLLIWVFVSKSFLGVGGAKEKDATR